MLQSSKKVLDLVLGKSVLQSHVLALEKGVLCGVTVRCTLKQALVIADVMSSTLVSVQERHIIVIQFLGQG